MPCFLLVAVILGAACVVLFSSLDVLLSVSSINTLFIFALVAVAMLVRRYYYSWPSWCWWSRRPSLVENRPLVAGRKPPLVAGCQAGLTMRD